MKREAYYVASVISSATCITQTQICVSMPINNTQTTHFINGYSELWFRKLLQYLSMNDSALKIFMSEEEIHFLKPPIPPAINTTLAFLSFLYTYIYIYIYIHISSICIDEATACSGFYGNISFEVFFVIIYPLFTILYYFCSPIPPPISTV
jgi:hypothetical protein